MRMRSRRLQKKLHRKWLDLGVIDASLVPYWRRRLFASQANEVFSISPADTTGLGGRTAEAIVRYGLHYSVRVAAPDEADAWLGEGGNVVFVFWATQFPSVRRFTGNNPRVV